MPISAFAKPVSCERVAFACALSSISFTSGTGSGN
jgi:hypothetical protein